MTLKVNVLLTVSPARRNTSNFTTLPTECTQFSLEDRDDDNNVTLSLPKKSMNLPYVDERIFVRTSSRNSNNPSSINCEQFYSNPVFETVYKNSDSDIDGDKNSRNIKTSEYDDCRLNANFAESHGLLNNLRLYSRNERVGLRHNSVATADTGERPTPTVIPSTTTVARRNRCSTLHSNSRLTDELELSLDANHLGADESVMADGYYSDDDDLDFLPASLSTTFPTGGNHGIRAQISTTITRKISAFASGSVEGVKRLIYCCWPTSAAKCNFL